MTAAMPGRVEHMRRLNADPEFAAARDERARAVLRENRAEITRRSNLARRGVDVPKHLQEAWRDLKAKKISNREAAEMLGLRWSPSVAADRLAAELAKAALQLRSGELTPEAVRTRLAEIARPPRRSRH